MGCLRFLLSLAGVLAVWPAVAAAQSVTPVAGLVGRADAIVAGPDGALWATLSEDPGRVARVTTDGVVTYPAVGGFSTFPVNREPYGLTVSPQVGWGTLWFLFGNAGGGLAGLTLDGRVTPFSFAYGRPTSLVGGPDGALWMTFDGEQGRSDAITRFRPQPYAESQFTAGLTATSQPDLITAGAGRCAVVR